MELAKPFRYSAHLKDRLAVRGIDEGLPLLVFREAKRTFFDVATGYRIAVARAPFRGRPHLMMVAYEETETEIVGVTIHPLAEGDVEAKLRNERWIP